MKNSSKKLGLYIHVPFCEKKCDYCDFYSIVNKEDAENVFLEALLTEIRQYESKLTDYEIDSVFIGGGTPSSIKAESIGIILEELKKRFDFSKECEITIEANPNSIDESKVEKYISYGINRMSLGIQSLDNNILAEIGRLHNSKEAINAIRIIKNSGMKNLNADVMFNIPNQTVQNVENTLKLLIDEGVEHISFYSLKLEEGTLMNERYNNELFDMPDEDLERETYYSGRTLMKKHGYNQYEISNFSKSGFECKHNLKYWSGNEYIGLGPFSHSFFSNVRYSNISDLNKYSENINNTDKYRSINEILDDEAKKFERIILNLRLNRGLDISAFNKEFKTDFFENYENQINNLSNNGLIFLENGYIKLTERGMDISNSVFEEFLV